MGNLGIDCFHRTQQEWNNTLASFADQPLDPVKAPKTARASAADQPMIEPIKASLAAIRRGVATLSEPIFLESTRPDPVVSRWSIFAADPAQTLTIHGLQASIQTRGSGARNLLLKPVWKKDQYTQKLTALILLRYWTSQWQTIFPDQQSHLHIPGPFNGGAIGWVGYDFGRHLEKLPDSHDSTSQWEDLRLGLFDTFVVYDHKFNQAHLVALNLRVKTKSSVKSRLEVWKKAISKAARSKQPNHWPGLKVAPCLNRPEYISKVSRVLEYIKAGDIFQANFTHRFEAIGEGDPLALYENLARISPAPFAAYAEWADKSIICSSPEWFYRVEGDRVITRPIKGTRPRGVTPEEDAANQSELLSSTKDKAELTMIVDLERNDLGRVCELGSVKVNQALTLESYAQVHHLVAEIEGRLSPYHDDIDLLAAMFPGGSITGAPKIRAMEIIEELETHQRGVYTGAIGYIGMDGRSAWNISIRTIVRSGEVWSYNVGGGIVADSVPEEEFDETLSKAAGMKSALETPYP